ncbi:hypothetical protein [Rubrivirga sp. IMCC45206]|uniref:hypothetical protein n=1 Tax=Rubrivirga sp. IMCC45206 TaxID=3391614 RepID=UPI00398F99A2
MLRALDDPDDLRRFLDLREERDRIDADLAQLAPVILAALDEEDDGRTEARGYVIESATRRTYDYPPEVGQVADYLAEIKATARADRSASVADVTSFIRVKRSPTVRADRARALAAEAVTATLAA